MAAILLLLLLLLLLFLILFCPSCLLLSLLLNPLSFSLFLVWQLTFIIGFFNVGQKEVSSPVVSACATCCYQKLKNVPLSFLPKSDAAASGRIKADLTVHLSLQLPRLYIVADSSQFPPPPSLPPSPLSLPWWIWHPPPLATTQGRRRHSLHAAAA
jgi:hypothetical protein